MQNLTECVQNTHGCHIAVHFSMHSVSGSFAFNYFYILADGLVKHTSGTTILSQCCQT